MIKAMIVDDEQSSIELLQWLAAQYCPDITSIQNVLYKSSLVDASTNKCPIMRIHN